MVYGCHCERGYSTSGQERIIDQSCFALVMLDSNMGFCDKGDEGLDLHNG